MRNRQWMRKFSWRSITGAESNLSEAWRLSKLEEKPKRKWDDAVVQWCKE